MLTTIYYEREGDINGEKRKPRRQVKKRPATPHGAGYDAESTHGGRNASFCYGYYCVISALSGHLFYHSGNRGGLPGELQSFLLGVALVLPASLLYRHKKTRKEALLGMTAGTLVSTLVAVLTNLYLIIPFYVALYDMNMDQIILSCSKVNPMMNSVTTMVILGIVPFNLIKYGISCLITFAVYKKISPMIHRFANRQ